VAYSLRKLGFNIMFVSRTPRNKNEISYENITRQTIKNIQLIVNTSPVGMYPNVNSFPLIPYDYLTSDHILYDLIYNPEETIFMAKGKEMGSKVINGMQMLKLQAEKAWEIWNNKD
jgi:shikimate dehydrogenase